jgi:hypothetical protein
MSTPRFHLSDEERGVLVGLIADRPLASCAAIAAEFEVRTGRRIVWQTVHRVMARGGYSTRPGNGHLSEAGRGVLAGLIREAGGGTTCREIADRFRRATRRAISVQRVWQARKKIMTQETR